MEEGELTIRVREANGSSQFEKIVTMIEESEKLKSGLVQRKTFMDKLVPPHWQEQVLPIFLQEM